jgi:beta-galactosidase
MYQNSTGIASQPKELVAQINEHAQLDAQRWFAEEAADYLRFQTGVLRKHCGNRQWITSNLCTVQRGELALLEKILRSSPDTPSGARQFERSLPASGLRRGDVLLAVFIAASTASGLDGIAARPGELGRGQPATTPSAIHLGSCARR